LDNSFKMDVEKLKVSELKAALAEKGLDTKGNKAALIERLQAANSSDEGNVNDCKSNNGNEINDQENILLNEKEACADNIVTEEKESDVKNNLEEDCKIDDVTIPEPLEQSNNTTFEEQEFVSKKPTGVSFELHDPTPVKPQPKELLPPDDNRDQTDEGSRRAGAATYFSEKPGDTGTGEAAVPLPPSTGYGLEESEDDDDEGPPGIGTVTLPSDISKDLEPKSSLDDNDDPVSWRPYVAVPKPIPDTAWVEEKHIQSPALFLKEEAEMAGEELVYEVEDNDVPGLSPTSLKMQLTYFDGTVTSQGDSEELAMEAAALAMLKEAGPWIEDSVFEEVTTGIKASLPIAYMSWLPPLYDLSHVSMVDAEGATYVGEQPGRKLYKVSVKLGPIRCDAVTDTVQEGLECLGQHLKSFLRTRDLKKLTEQKFEDEDFSKFRFVKGSGIVKVIMEGEGKTPVLPPLDLFTLQKKLKDGKFPPNYCVKDEYGCCKVFLCDLCSTRSVGADALKNHVESGRHMRRLGKFFVNGHEHETFRASSTPHIPKADTEDPVELEKFTVKICSACEEDGVTEIASGKCVECNDLLCEVCTEAHSKTRVTKNHVIDRVDPPIIHHPRKDAAEGREVKGDSEGYLIRIYRCGTIKGKGNKEGEDEVPQVATSSSRWGPPSNTGQPVMGGIGPFGHPMMPPGIRPPGFGPPSGMGALMGGIRPPGFGPTGPGDAAGQGGTQSQEMPAPVKSGLVNDPMAGISNPGPQFPNQWGPSPGQWGPQGGPWGGPPGPWGPRPPFPPNMICISQGNSGKPCKHFQRGQCTYGNRCIHLHLVPANQGAQQATQDNPEGEDSDESDDEEEGEGNAPGVQVDKRAEAKKKAFEEAMKAAKAAAAKAGDISLGTSSTASSSTPSQPKVPDLSLATTKMGGHMMMHAYSVGQKSKKKDPKPEEQRPGDWQCECGNYNFSWRKKCNACDRNKPFNPAEEESKQKELERIKEDRARRRAQQQEGQIDPGDLRNLVRERNKRDRERDRDRDRERDRERDSRERGSRSSRERDRGGFGSSGRRYDDEIGNANMVPLGPSKRMDSGSSEKHRDRHERRDSDRSDRDRDRSYSHRERDRDDYDIGRDRSRRDDREDYVRERKEKKHKSDRHHEDEKRSRENEREGSKKHKKSHKSSKDVDYPTEKKKKRKDRSRDREGKDRKRSRREEDEEGEIPGDWNEWYDQGGAGSSKDNYRGKHYEHDDRRY